MHHHLGPQLLDTFPLGAVDRHRASEAPLQEQQTRFPMSGGLDGWEFLETHPPEPTVGNASVPGLAWESLPGNRRPKLELEPWLPVDWSREVGSEVEGLLSALQYQSLGQRGVTNSFSLSGQTE